MQVPLSECELGLAAGRAIASSQRQLDALLTTPPRSPTTGRPSSRVQASETNIAAENAPVASTSRLPRPPTPPATPQSPRRRQSSISATATTLRRRPFLLPLERLVPAGVIVLDADAPLPPSHRAPVPALDGWAPLTWESLEPIPVAAPARPAPPAEMQVSPRATLLPPSLVPVPPATKKRKGGSTPRTTPAKRPRGASARTPSRLLDDILLLQDALVLRATFRVVDGVRAVVRIYLVPTDLAERRLEAVEKTAKARPAESTIVKVLAAVATGKESWEGDATQAGPSLLDEPDQRSLLELYRAVASPPDNLKSQALTGLSDEVFDRIKNALEETPSGEVATPRGMRTKLYRYQRASLGKMLARELAPQSHPHPTYLRTKSSINGSPFFIGVGGDVRLDPPKLREPKGGVLAEEMGTGKTVICLALVLSTKGDLPDLSSVRTHLDGTPSPPPTIMTRISLSLPFAAYHNETLRLRSRVPPPLLGYELSMTELDEYQALLDQQALSDALEPRKPLPSLRTLTTHLIKARAVPYDDRPELSGSNLLAELDANTPFYYLSPSPEQLDSREGRKGAYTPLKILVSTTSLIVVPTDLVRQWKGELEKHVDGGALKVLVLKTTKDKFPASEELVTFDVVILSISRFGDAAGDLDSPLRKIHWKRLFVDEGHALSGANHLRKLADELHCECRWAISGTPTTNLRGADDEGAIFSQGSTTGGSETDFQRLGEIYSRFLHHPAFPKPDVWRATVTVPILQEQRGAQRLAELLDRSFVRNAPEQIKRAYTLPPLTSTVKYLDFLEGERKTYNSLLALFAVNSIQSQRIDDYLFQPQNRKFLDELTLNLSTASVFFASQKLYGRLEDAIVHSNELLASHKSLLWSEEDRQGQRKAISVFEEALHDREWRHVVQSTAIAFEVRGLDKSLVQTFSGLPAAENPNHRTLLPSSQLVRLRTNLKEVRRPDIGKWQDDEELVEELITFEEKRRREENTPANPNAPLSPRKKRKPGEVEQLLPLPDRSDLLEVTVGATTSVKLNYVISEVQKYPEDKFIIFSSTLSDLVFAQLSEAFDIVGIPHAIFAGSAHKRDRGATAAEFNASPAAKCRAILVDAKMGGRGMQLAGANRVIMLEPIWLPDLEVQAGKRAHRLGQLKPVDLQVLVIKGSYEDALLLRRGQLGQADFAKSKVPQRDSKIRDLLQAAEYLGPTPTSDVAARVRFIRPDVLLSPTGPAEGIAAALEGGEKAVSLKSEGGSPPRKKAKKSVWFSG